MWSASSITLFAAAVASVNGARAGTGPARLDPESRSLASTLTALETGLASVLSGLGLSSSLQADATKHGKVFDWHAIYKEIAGKTPGRHAHAAPWTTAARDFPGWATYKGNGVNLGAWLEIESTYVPDVIPAGYDEEWTWCEAVGFAACGPILDAHYASYISTADIDKAAKYGINTLRIPTTYAAWASIPGSWLYHGSQQAHLRSITEYAISQHNMHVIIGLHSLPGGTNDIALGEASGHDAWWYNSTNLALSLEVVGNALDWINKSAHPRSFTFSPINEPCDNVAYFGTSSSVSYPDGVNYLNTYFKAVQALLKAKGMTNALLLSDAFRGAAYWVPFWTVGKDNVLFDSHFYYFYDDSNYAQYTGLAACGQAQAAATTFPVFVGEFSAASTFNNTLDGRKAVYETEVYAWSKWLSGGAFWNIKDADPSVLTSGNPLAATGVVNNAGEGLTADYWSFFNLIDAGQVEIGGAITIASC